MDLEYYKEIIIKTAISKVLLITIALTILAFILKGFIKKEINKSESFNLAEKRKISSRIFRVIDLVLVSVLVVVWFTHLQNVLVSLLAVAAAVVLATKELIMCFTGGFLIGISRYFTLGDRIEIDGLRGFVIEKNLTTTKILEIGPEKNSQQTTGNVISIPNSLMLSKSLSNESYFKGYSIRSFNFNVPKEFNVEDFEGKLLEWGRQLSAAYINDAKSVINSYSEKENIPIPSVEPRVRLAMNGDSGFQLILKMPVKSSEVADIEQELLRRYATLSSPKV